MANVEQIPINARMPSDAVCVVAMQPFVRLHSIEPFKWLDDMVEMQLGAISRTLNLAQNGFEGSSVNVTLFPEYSIPGIAGAVLINERVISADWPNESIIIAGVDGLMKSEYRDLCQQLSVIVSPENDPSSVPDDKWVNCCLIWVKEQNGVVRLWGQPKIRPAWSEMNVRCKDMFCGATIYVFECQYLEINYPCRFVTFVCFDWVASVAGRTVCDKVLDQLNTQWGSPSPLHWVFVIQHNTNPNHDTFLNSTRRFLTGNTFHFVERREAVVIHANTAATAEPSRNNLGGFSACVFSPGARLDCTVCRPTVCMQTSTLRRSNILNICNDVVFREMGECIHMYKVRVPRFIDMDASGRTYPLTDAQVHPVNNITDPRLCGRPVPAAVKWLNDSLDLIARLATPLVGCSLEAHAESIAFIVISELRELDGPSATTYLKWAACPRNADEQKNPDFWDQIETDALEHVVNSLISLSLTYEVSVNNSSFHGILNRDIGYVQVVAIRGETHAKCCLHYDNVIHKAGTDPILVITRDRDNYIPAPEEFSRFYEPDSVHGLRFLDYQTLANCCRRAEDNDALRRCLDEFLPGERRII